MKRQPKKKTPPKPQPIPPHIQLMLSEYQGRDRDLLSQYKSPRVILERLCEMSTSITTCELVGEMFFEFVVHDTEHGHPGVGRMRQIGKVRYDIMMMFELARAAKMFRDREKFKV